MKNYWLLLKADLKRLYQMRVFMLVVIVSFVLGVATGLFPFLNPANALYVSVFILPVLIFSFSLQFEINNQESLPKTDRPISAAVFLLSKITSAVLIQLIPLLFIIIALVFMRGHSKLSGTRRCLSSWHSQPYRHRLVAIDHQASRTDPTVELFGISPCLLCSADFLQQRSHTLEITIFPCFLSGISFGSPDRQSPRSEYLFAAMAFVIVGFSADCLHRFAFPVRDQPVFQGLYQQKPDRN